MKVINKIGSQMDRLCFSRQLFLLTACFSTFWYLSKYLMHVDLPDPMFPSIDTLKGLLFTTRAVFVIAFTFDITIKVLSCVTQNFSVFFDYIFISLLHENVELDLFKSSMNTSLI